MTYVQLVVLVSSQSRGRDQRSHRPLEPRRPAPPPEAGQMKRVLHRLRSAKARTVVAGWQPELDEIPRLISAACQIAACGPSTTTAASGDGTTRSRMTPTAFATSRTTSSSADRGPCRASGLRYRPARAIASRSRSRRLVPMTAMSGRLRCAPKSVDSSPSGRCPYEYVHLDPCNAKSKVFNPRIGTRRRIVQRRPEVAVGVEDICETIIDS